jgi:hypothetical protein
MKKTLLIAALALVMILSSAVAAQEATPEAQGGVDLEGLTGDPSLYVGQMVSLEGVVEDLVNVRAFVLGEGVAIDNDQVLVINTSGEEFDIRVTDGSRFVVTGTVYPTFADGGLTQIIARLAESGDLGETMATEDPMMDAMLPRSTNLAEMLIPDTLFDYTIVELASADDLQFVQIPE